MAETSSPLYFSSSYSYFEGYVDPNIVVFCSSDM